MSQSSCYSQIVYQHIFRSLFGLLTFGLVGIGLPGCKQEQLEQLAKQVKESTIDKIDQVAGPIKLPGFGSMKLQLANSIETKAANARIVVIGDGRSNTLQIRSYTDVTAEDYPMVLIQANTTASQLSQLQGETLRATVYIAASQYLPIWSCMDQTTATVTITGIQDGMLKATVQCDKLISTEDKTSPLSGTIEAVVPTPSVALSDERIVK